MINRIIYRMHLEYNKIQSFSDATFKKNYLITHINSIYKYETNKTNILLPIKK